MLHDFFAVKAVAGIYCPVYIFGCDRFLDIANFEAHNKNLIKDKFKCILDWPVPNSKWP